jgi:caspase 7
LFLILQYDTFSQNVAVMPCEKDSELYNMNHRRRGLAIVFNHKNFDPRLGLKTRNGTDADRDNLRSTLRTLDFAVKVYNDLPYKEMERILEEASNENHADADCILVAVLSHGELGILYSCDQPYKPDRLWGHFNAEKCPTLAGKPKLFFVQVIICF